MGELFKVHGEFCASHPLEVVVTTVTVIMSLVSMGSTIPVEGGRVCGWNYDCAKAQVKCELHHIKKLIYALNTLMLWVNSLHCFF